MNAIRKYITTNTGILSIEVPESYKSKQLEVIIIPLNENSNEIKDVVKLKKAHRIIDAGGGDSLKKLLVEFEESRQDRHLPFNEEA